MQTVRSGTTQTRQSYRLLFYHMIARLDYVEQRSRLNAILQPMKNTMPCIHTRGSRDSEAAMPVINVDDLNVEMNLQI